MKTYYKFLFSILIMFVSFNSIAQCGAGMNEIIVEISPDSYPGEISWNLTANGNLIGSGTSIGDTFCVSNTSCVSLQMIDSYGDGICCAYGNGFFNLRLNGAVVATGGNYGLGQTVYANCPPGTSCDNPLTTSTGSFTAPMPNSWYEFTATSTGIYEISTCGGSTCDTKIWVYDNCVNINESNTGTIFYDDNQGGCGEQAVVNAYLTAGQTVLVRIGFDAAAPTCANNNIGFTISYSGPVTGCTDPTACNYDPLATVSGTCYYYPDPNCPAGPDLEILQNPIDASLQMRTEVATNCMVDEGCMNGYGTRTVLAFDTHIQNNGETDYYIGNPTTNPTQFSFGNCHGHAHYEGYADYILYKANGTSIPIGHKNGFCVMDLECNNGGNMQYGCGNMGISKDCGDIYANYLDCQWVDVTDVDTGEYILAIKVNWDQSPDALGRYEMEYDNNWAQVCIKLTKDAQGNMGYTTTPNCQPYVDCMGTLYGNSVVDCEGNCGGTAMRGDVDLNQLIELNDGDGYVNGIVNSTIAVSPCKDISDDGIISVWDAGLAINCALNAGPGSNNCDFPNTVENINQYAEIGYTEINTSQGYIDVYLRNPDCKIIGYEFNVSGIEIASVQSLIDPLEYPATPAYLTGGNKVVCISDQDSLISKHVTPTPLARIYYSQITDPTICVDQIIHVLNDNYEPIIMASPLNCISVAGVDELGMQDFNLYPNPAQNAVSISLKVKAEDNFDLIVLDAMGRELKKQKLNAGSIASEIEVNDLPNGIYQVVLTNGNTRAVKNLSIIR